MSPQFWIFWVIVVAVTVLVGLFWKAAQLDAWRVVSGSGGGANAAEGKRNGTGRRWRRMRPKQMSDQGISLVTAP
jgi:hypothetical protein